MEQKLDITAHMRPVKGVGILLVMDMGEGAQLHRIAAAADDADAFVSVVDGVVDGIARAHRPVEVVVVKIDNWFGDKWLKFSGKVFGALGVSHIDGVKGNGHGSGVFAPPWVMDTFTGKLR
jgi:hypothetical protein